MIIVPMSRRIAAPTRNNRPARMLLRKIMPEFYLAVSALGNSLAAFTCSSAARPSVATLPPGQRVTPRVAREADGNPGTRESPARPRR
jgi:hypothetical protein